MEISVFESCRSQMREWLMFTSEILRTLETPNTANQESYFLTSQPSWRLCMRVLAVKNMNHGDLTVCHPQDTEICTPQEDLQIDMEDIEMIPMMIGSGVARLPEDPLEDHHDTTTIAEPSSEPPAILVAWNVLFSRASSRFDDRSKYTLTGTISRLQ
jgi:hypothetical protein